MSLCPLCGAREVYADDESETYACGCVTDGERIVQRCYPDEDEW